MREHDERDRDGHDTAGLRRARRREQQRLKAQRGMRVGPRPDALRPASLGRPASPAGGKKRGD